LVGLLVCTATAATTAAIDITTARFGRVQFHESVEHVKNSKRQLLLFIVSITASARSLSNRRSGRGGALGSTASHRIRHLAIHFELLKAESQTRKLRKQRPAAPV
jgi:hypothetical protein